MEVAKPTGNHYTYADYCTWPEDERREIIEGVPYAHATPSRIHQTVSKKIFRQLDVFLDGKPCEVFYAPFSVRLNADSGDNTVVEPDLFVVCDESKLKDGKSVAGPPDFLIEILSPATSKRDKVEKLRIYRETGVREYWIVDPSDRTVLACVFEPDSKSVKAYDDEDAAPVHVLDGCVIDLAAVFVE